MELSVKGGKKVKELLKNLKVEMNDIRTVHVGYFKSAKYLDGTSVPEVAVKHEFGQPSERIPARPTMRPAIEMMKQELPKMTKSMIQEQLHKDPKTFAELYPKRIGAVMQGYIQLMISLLTTPELSETTKRIRRTRTVNPTTSEKPLIDTGTMRTAVTWRITNNP